jgi:hypothetical protein
MTQVVREPPTQVLFVERDHVVQKFAADGHLLCGPGRGRRISKIEVQDFAPLMRQDHEDIEDAEGGGRDDKEISPNAHQLLTNYTFITQPLAVSLALKIA